METQELRRIQTVDVHDLWGGNENDAGFACWLSNNLDLLGRELYMDLELVCLEPGKRGIWFWSAILAKEVGSGVKAAIVGRPSTSDHNHLSYLPGYAAEHDARILIMVSPRIRDEHHKALEWLNRNTADEIEVYGVEVRAIKIGDSLPAIDFRPVVAPDAWHSRGESWAWKYRGFFQSLADELDIEDLNLNTTGPYTSHWQARTHLDGSISYYASFESGRKAWVYLWIATDDLEKNRRIYEALRNCASDLERELDGGIKWIGRRGRRSQFSLGISKEGSIDDSDEKIDDTRDWMLEYIPKFMDAVNPRLEKIWETLQ